MGQLRKLTENDVLIHPKAGMQGGTCLFWHGSKLFRACQRRLPIEQLSGAPIQRAELVDLALSLGDRDYGYVYRHPVYTHHLRVDEVTPSAAATMLASACAVALRGLASGRCLYDIHEGNLALTLDGPLWLDWGSFAPRDHVWDGFAFMCRMVAQHVYQHLPSDGPPLPLSDQVKALRRRVFPDGEPNARTRQHPEPQRLAWTRLRKLLKAAAATPPRKTDWYSYPCGRSGLRQLESGRKAQIVSSLLSTLTFDTATDIGCNKGYFSMLAAQSSHSVVGLDVDEACIAHATREAQEARVPALFGIKDIAHLQDLALGEDLRLRSDLVMALAVTHHLPSGISVSAFATVACRLANRYVLVEDIDHRDAFKEAARAAGFQLARRVASHPEPRTISVYQRASAG